jgi:hypothetical protein
MPSGKTGLQGAFKTGAAFSRVPGETAAEAEAAGLEAEAKVRALKKAAGEEAGETAYLLSRAEIPVRGSSGDDPDGEGLSLSGPEALESSPGFGEDTGLSAFSAEEADLPSSIPGSVPGFPEPGEAAAGENRSSRSRFPEAADDSESGLEQRAGEFSPPGKAGIAGAGKADAERDEKRPQEARRNERRRERGAVFEVRDLRATGEAVPADFELRDGAFPEDRLPGQEIDLSVELKGENRGGAAANATADASPGGEKTFSQAFEDILARELHQNLNGDIVRHASVVLREGGEGLIRLSLKPDTLGNVKIRLEMAENKITGHIVVESDEALRAFEREIGALEQAFKDSGFDGADLSMSLASGDNGARQRQEGETVPFFSERFASEQAASRYDAFTEKTDGWFAIGLANGLKPGNGRISVNLLI